jgi:hypothetical protein
LLALSVFAPDREGPARVLVPEDVLNLDALNLDLLDLDALDLDAPLAPPDDDFYPPNPDFF